MVSLVMGAAMMGTMYFLWARCAQHGVSASGRGLVCVSLRSYKALLQSSELYKESLLSSCCKVCNFPIVFGDWKTG